MIGNDRDEVIDKLFWSLLYSYHEALEQSMKSSDLSLIISMDCITNRFRSWCMLHRFSWLNNILNNMQYAITFALKHEIIKKSPQRI